MQMANTTIQKKLSLINIQVCFFAVALFASGGAMSAPTIKLTETQTEKLKCLKDKTCTKLTTGTYSAKITLDISMLAQYPNLLLDFGVAKYLADNNLDLTSLLANGLTVSAISKLKPAEQKALLNLPKNIVINPSAVMEISIGDYNFSDTYANNVASKKSPTGYWTSYHAKKSPSTPCIGPGAGCVKDGSLTWSFGFNGIVLNFTGTTDAVNGYGQSVLAGACVEAADLTSADPTKTVKKTVTVTKTGSITIGQSMIPISINGNCAVTKPADPKNKQNGPFNLVNLKITGK